MNLGKLYLVPQPLAEDAWLSLSPQAMEVAARLTHWLVESDKTARRLVVAARKWKGNWDGNLNNLNLQPVADPDAWRTAMEWLQAGLEVGMASDAGCPGVADPGADVVRMAHQLGAIVVPLSGPSSLSLALMASGLNGQRFRFHGYLERKPPLRKRQLQQLGRDAQTGETQLWIESPHRNLDVWTDALACLPANLCLCLAANLTTPSAWCRSLSIEGWKLQPPPPVHRQPCVFLLGT